ncbi:MAG TPA: Fe(3+) ABC transporter substrate-binding protein [Hyphomicrobiaceae bacterium]|nr:Fe(3+) ABC transporter substrate-binding protein [Hyphomicrobiaceae bacterium]
MTMPRCLGALAAALALTSFASTAASAAEKVNIYSYRQPQLIDPMLKAFTAKTGIETNIVYANAGLEERIQAEGANSPADLLFTVDIGRLGEAKDRGITAPVSLADVKELANIPPSFRDPEGHWFALTQRARVVYASKERVKQTSITYEELADPKWKGKICIRPGQHVYNVSLIAWVLAHKGEAATETWLKGLKENLARKPAGGDREQVRDVQAGLCDLAVGNTYYMAAMLKDPKQKAWAESVRIIFPNAETTGTHVNVSGVSLIKSAPNKAAALKLIAFLASDQGQHLYAEANSEYPIDPNVPPTDLVKSWGKLVPDKTPLADISALRKKASELVDKVKFNDGPGS